METFRVSVFFGGAGFIGSHFARYLVTSGMTEHVYLVDLNPPNLAIWPPALRQAYDDGCVTFVPYDVRQPLLPADLPDHVDLIANFAAVHREPGHQPHEYFETNLLGAEHVCAWAERVKCPWIVFTSSIAPYGPTEERKDEKSVPMPVSPYGSSKLAAEKMHLAWQRGGAERRLTIVRPGVVFGPGEGGNVTRLIRAVLGRYFFYMGNRRTRKAGGYVKELCCALIWMMERQLEYKEDVALFNFTMNPAPAVEEYVETICRVAGVRRIIPALPYRLLLGASYPIEALCRPLGIQQPISPVRIRKLVHSNNIVPKVLRDAGYEYRYTLESAFADWRQERPEDWR